MEAIAISSKHLVIPLASIAFCDPKPTNKLKDQLGEETNFDLEEETRERERERTWFPAGLPPATSSFTNPSTNPAFVIFCSGQY